MHNCCALSVELQLKHQLYHQTCLQFVAMKVMMVCKLLVSAGKLNHTMHAPIKY
jgi:hypothetical protein